MTHLPAAVCWMNGQILPAAEARISVFDHGLLYGDGVFEGIRFYQGRPFRLAAHLARLNRSARALCLAVPFDAGALMTAVAETIVAYGAPDGYLRLVVTRGVGPLGVDPTACRQPTAFILASPLSLVPEVVREAGVKVITAATRRLPLDGLDPRIKSLNYLNAVLARLEARCAGADEALLLNAAGRVAEGSVDNVFVVRDGVLLTPPTIDGALDGVTRGVILKLAAAGNLPAREASLAPYDLYTADEVFLCGTGAELIPVREVDGRLLAPCPGPVFQQLQAAFAALVATETGGDHLF